MFAGWAQVLGLMRVSMCLCLGACGVCVSTCLRCGSVRVSVPAFALVLACVRLAVGVSRFRLDAKVHYLISEFVFENWYAWKCVYICVGIVLSMDCV